MEQRVSIIPLGAADLSRSRGFYERLGWRRSMAEPVCFLAIPASMDRAIGWIAEIRTVIAANNTWLVMWICLDDE